MNVDEMGEPRGDTAPWYNPDRPDLLVEVFSRGKWSAVKVTHIETGNSIVSTAANSRMENKEIAIKILDSISIKDEEISFDIE